MWRKRYCDSVTYMTTARSHEELNDELKKVIEKRTKAVKKTKGSKKTAKILERKKKDVTMRAKI